MVYSPKTAAGKGLAKAARCSLLPQPVYRPVPGERAVELVEDFHLEHFALKKGYRWNGQTTPWWSWWIAGTPFEPESMAGSGIHDKIYEDGGYTDEDGKFHRVSRTRADAIFFDICHMYSDGSRSARYRIWRKHKGLRLGGWWIWNKYRAQDGE